MESILVGVDHSQDSVRAARFAIERAALTGGRVAIERAALTGGRVAIAHVVYWSKFAFPTTVENEARPGQVVRERERARAETLDPITEWAEAEGHLDKIELVSKVLHGRPSEVLADLGQSGDYDMIVVARTGESHLRNAIFGSTVDRLVRHAPVPVVVVP